MQKLLSLDPATDMRLRNINVFYSTGRWLCLVTVVMAVLPLAAAGLPRLAVWKPKGKIRSEATPEPDHVLQPISLKMGGIAETLPSVRRSCPFCPPTESGGAFGMQAKTTLAQTAKDCAERGAQELMTKTSQFRPNNRAPLVAPHKTQAGLRYVTMVGLHEFAGVL